MTETLTEKVVAFDEACRDGLAGLVKSQAFWRDAMENGVQIPFDAADDARPYRWINVAQYLNDRDEETNAYPLDVEATQRELAKVVQWAKRRGWKIEKKYDDNDFKIILDDTPIGRVEWYSTRQVVCKRIQTGTKVIPERVEPEYEYQCDKVAFLKVEV